MAKIPLHTKVALINNYIQNNYLRSRGKAEHDDWRISDILEAIKEDLNTLAKSQEVTSDKQGVPIELILRDLKYYRDKQEGAKSEITGLIDRLKEILEQQSDPESNIDKIIKNLEDNQKAG